MKNLNLKRAPTSANTKNGEHWFFYWKVAPSLWKERLGEFVRGSTIFVPINWRIHHINANTIDFHQDAKRDLGKLHYIGQELGLSLILLFPIAPLPLEQASGVPDFIQTTKSKDKNNMNRVFMQSDGTLFTQASFYDPSLFEHYYAFTSAFHQWLQGRKEIKTCLANYQLIENNTLVSLFDDHCVHFEKGFSRYIKKQKILNQKSQDEWEANYKKEIQNLYKETAIEILDKHLIGSLHFIMLGAGSEQFLMRTFSADARKSGYFYDALLSLEHDYLPTTILLNESEKVSGVDEFLKEVYSESFLNHKIHEDFDFNESDFFPFSLINLYGFGMKTWLNWEDSKLCATLRKKYPWLVMKKSEDDLDVDDPSLDQLYIFGGELTKDFFHKIINLFLSGTSSFIDTALLPEEVKKKLEIFILENSLQVEMVNFVIPIRKASLGESSMVLFSSAELLNKTKKEQAQFWQQLLKTTHIAHLDTMDVQESVYTFWQKRAGSPYELNYQEVRRLFLYNPSEEKQIIKIGPHKNFALLKSMKSRNGKISSTNKGVEVSLEPHGSLSLDYGYFSEKGEL